MVNQARRRDSVRYCGYHHHHHHQRPVCRMLDPIRRRSQQVHEPMLSGPYTAHRTAWQHEQQQSRQWNEISFAMSIARRSHRRWLRTEKTSAPQPLGSVHAVSILSADPEQRSRAVNAHMRVKRRSGQARSARVSGIAFVPQLSAGFLCSKMDLAICSRPTKGHRNQHSS